ncbi:MAG: hypoxanthine phosphoribosyltransferase, partial [Bacteroidales bacterium]|nr:hypoxanthine phosphoribosyltransferase [Bacteroidales bacterium]
MEQKRVQILDKEFQISIPAAEIEASIDQLAVRLNKDYEGKNPLFIIVLNGAFMFASDLLKKITIDCEITFVKLSSYVGTTSTHA